MDNETKPTYGVWIPGQGWLKAGGDTFADYNRDLAEEVARCIGRGARVRYIDKSIVELEGLYLDSEGRQLWQRFKSYIERKNSK